MADTEAAEIEHPAPGGAALLIIDLINDMDFKGAEDLKRDAEAAVRATVELREAADRLRLPVVYVNDNFGQWHSERSRLIEHCLGPDAPGRELVKLIEPRSEDYFVIKPQFSGFYATNLPVLLPKLGANRVILTGVAADICVLFTAADAHMREYGLWVPRNTTASESRQRTDWAIEIMRTSMDAETRPTTELKLEDWLGATAPASG